jgi:hypothetical protein
VTLAGAGYALAGVALLLVLSFDVIVTTLMLRSSGPLSGPATRLVWRMLGRLRSGKRGGELVAQLSGPAVVVAMFCSWGVLLWAGWGLVFMADEQAVVSSPGGQSATPLQRFYFAGTCFTTVGIGDFVPGTRWSRIAAVVASGFGFALISLSITFLLAVLSAVVEHRVVATRILGLGETVIQMLADSWDGERLPHLEAVLPDLGTELLRVAHQHHAYPVLYAFRSGDRAVSLTVAVAVLDELVSVMTEGIENGRELLPRATVRTLRLGVHTLLDGAPDGDQRRRCEVPPLPERRPLQEVGLPVIDAPAFAARFETLAPHRLRLRNWLQADGWDWSVVYDKNTGATGSQC